MCCGLASFSNYLGIAKNNKPRAEKPNIFYEIDHKLEEQIRGEILFKFSRVLFFFFFLTVNSANSVVGSGNGHMHRAHDSIKLIIE